MRPRSVAFDMALTTCILYPKNMKIQSYDKPIEAVLQGGYYRIPRFQRPYSWGREHVEDFLNDTLSDTPTEYFIGSLVVFKETHDDRFGLVDGQQRMTTITMMLCGVRDVFLQEGQEDLAKGIQNYIERRNKENRSEFILHPETSYPYFHTKIQTFPTEQDANDNPDISNEEQALKEAYEVITTLIQDRVQKIRNKRLTSTTKKRAIKRELENIRDAILRLNVIFIEVDNEDDSYIIFETLNTRGKDLTVTDLVKDYLARHIRPTARGVDRFKDRWIKTIKMIEEASADIETDQFLLHFWLSRYPYTTLKKLYKELKRAVPGSQAPNLLTNIEKDAEIYRIAIEPEYRSWTNQEEKIRQSLEAYRLFKIRQPLPYILSLLRAYFDRGFSLSSLRAALQLVENFHFCFSAITSHRSSGSVSVLYAQTARLLSSTNTTQDKANVVSTLRADLRNRHIAKDEFEIDFIQLAFSKKFTKKRSLVKYILSKLDEYHNNSGRTTNYSSMTIEHIAPQDGSSNNLSDEQIANIGNLILVDEETNKQLANKTFSQKKKILRQKNIWMSDVLSRARAWDAQAIERRAKELSDLAYGSVWRV